MKNTRPSKVKLGRNGRNLDQEILRTAVHESGHALCARLCGVHVEYVSIERDAESLGQTVYTNILRRVDPAARLTQHTRTLLLMKAVICLGGPLAEERVYPHGQYEDAEGDHRRAIEALDYCWGSPEGLQSYVDRLVRFVKRALRVHDKPVKQMAKALVESRRLSARKVRELIPDRLLSREVLAPLWGMEQNRASKPRHHVE